MRMVVVWLAALGCGDGSKGTSAMADASIDAPDAEWRYPYRQCMVPSDCDAATPYCCLYCGKFFHCGPSSCMDAQMAAGFCHVALCDPDESSCDVPGSSGTCRAFELPPPQPASIFRCY